MVPSPSLSNIWKVSLNSSIYREKEPQNLNSDEDDDNLACFCVNFPPGIGFRKTIGCLHSSQKLGRHVGPSASSFSFSFSAILTSPLRLPNGRGLPCSIRCHGYATQTHVMPVDLQDEQFFFTSSFSFRTSQSHMLFSFYTEFERSSCIQGLPKENSPCMHLK